MAAGALKVHLRKNQANGAQLVSILTAETGLFEDAVNTDAFVAADEVDYKQDTNQLATSGSILSAEVSILFENTDSTGRFVSLGGYYKSDARVVLVG